jgi:hypothetical protein
MLNPFQAKNNTFGGNTYYADYSKFNKEDRPPKKPTIKTGHEFLREMCRVKNFFSSSTPQLSPLSNRVIFIINSLNDIGVTYQLDIFGNPKSDFIDYNQEKRVNIVVELNKGDRSVPATVFCAHHDIVNVHSENAQDNSASICNLLHLCNIILENEKSVSLNKKPNKRIIILFTDGEECGGKGAIRFAEKVKDGCYGEISNVVNLELTGLGSEVWINNYSKTNNETNEKLTSILKEDNKELFVKGCPFNDAIPLQNNGIDSVCIGILPIEEAKGSTRNTWNLCHSLEDKFDKTNGEDMNKFVEVLYKLI